MLRDFTDSAKALTKNPLGVIGLFIVLVYGFACLVLGLGVSHLEASEKQPIIWFIVLFPVLILGVFYRLVTKYHKKLYAPSDFRDEKNFAEPLSEDRKEQRINEEITHIHQSEVTVAPDTGEAPSSTSLSAVRSRYTEAERLAFLATEEELGKPVQKYVRIAAHGRKEEFDGLLLTEESAHVIEIKYFSRPTFNREIFEAVLHRAGGVLWDYVFEGSKTRDVGVLWIIVVIDFPRDAVAEFKAKVLDLVRCIYFPVNFRFHHVDDLREKYGLPTDAGDAVERV